MYKPRVYTASSTRCAQMWRVIRNDPDWNFCQFTASWIDDPKIELENEGALTAQNCRDAWVKDLEDVRNSDILLLWGHDRLRGALVESGAAMALGLPVIAVGLPEDHTWSYHPRVIRVGTLLEARIHVYKYTVMVPINSRKRNRDNDPEST